MSKCKVLLAFIDRFLSISMFAKLISFALLLAVVFMVGLGVGLCINVFLVRGVPVIRAGGEFLLLFMVPSSFYIGYRFGGNRHNGGMGDIDDADADECDTNCADGANITKQINMDSLNNKREVQDNEQEKQT